MNRENGTTPLTPTREAGREHGSDSITDLIRDLATDLSSLLGKEIQLAKAEVSESVSETKTALGAMATGAVIAIAGLGVLLMSAVYGLSNVVELWLAALMVGATALLIGYVMVNSAKKNMTASSIVPDRALDSAKKDIDTLERATR